MEHNDLLLYTSEDGKIHVDVRLCDETVWLTQEQMGLLFGRDKRTVSEHISHVFDEGELEQEAVVRKFRTTAADGKNYEVNYYNLDVIISVGYRVRSVRGTQFRKWATQVLRNYIVKGFVINSERMKSGNSMNYFSQLEEQIREIRLSERVFYQKIKDIYKTSIDYDPADQRTIEFFKIVQNKLLWAISRKTAAELVASRADGELPFMGMLSCDKTLPQRITKNDAVTAKNYLRGCSKISEPFCRCLGGAFGFADSLQSSAALLLTGKSKISPRYSRHKVPLISSQPLTEDELTELGLLVEQYLAFAEAQARRHTPMYMRDWIAKLDDILKLNDRELLTNAGQISHRLAEEIAEKQLNTFRENLRIQERAESLKELEADMREAEKDVRSKKTRGARHA